MGPCPSSRSLASNPTMALWIVVLAGLAGLAAAQFAVDGDRERFGQRIRCHTCEADFSSERYDIKHPCLVGDRRENSRDLALCSRNARFCKAEVTRQHGLLVTFQRSCVEDCASTCVTKGFGIVRETCTFCCTSDPSCSEDIEEKKKVVQVRAVKKKDSTTPAPSGSPSSVEVANFHRLALFLAATRYLVSI